MSEEREFKLNDDGLLNSTKIINGIETNAAQIVTKVVRVIMLIFLIL